MGIGDWGQGGQGRIYFSTQHRLRDFQIKKYPNCRVRQCKKT
ncbi:hypothetical protein [Nostoc sp. CMAA1605]|nr:hypothetical protein [Nostoc sp. CMAA1605]